MERGYKKLILYQKAKKLIILIYKITTDYPKSETFGLVSQMRRSVISVLANVVEGYSKESASEYARFLTISIGSITELELYLDLSLDIGFIKNSDYTESTDLLIQVKKLLYSSRKSIRARIRTKFN